MLSDPYATTSRFCAWSPASSPMWPAIFLALADLAGILALTGRTVGPVRHRHAVAGAEARRSRGASWRRRSLCPWRCPPGQRTDRLTKCSALISEADIDQPAHPEARGTQRPSAAARRCDCHRLCGWPWKRAWFWQGQHPIWTWRNSRRGLPCGDRRRGNWSSFRTVTGMWLATLTEDPAHAELSGDYACTGRSHTLISTSTPEAKSNFISASTV